MDLPSDKIINSLTMNYLSTITRLQLLGKWLQEGSMGLSEDAIPEMQVMLQQESLLSVRTLGLLQEMRSEMGNDCWYRIQLDYPLVKRVDSDLARYEILKRLESQGIPFPEFDHPVMRFGDPE